MSEKDSVKCKSCGKDVPAGEDKCPHCGKDQRSFFGKYKILIAIVGMIIVVGAGALSAGGKDDVVDIDGDFIEVSASDLALAYEKDSKEADSTYKDQLVEVSGVISSVDLLKNRSYVILAPKEEVEEKDVQCVFENEDEAAKITDLKEGDSVVILGEVHGSFTNVEILKCILKD